MFARRHPFLPLACPVQNLPCGHRAGDTITLNKVTAHLPQRPGVFRGFHPFSEYRVGKPLGQEDHALHNGVVAGILKHVPHETLINLDDIHRQRAQVGER